MICLADNDILLKLASCDLLASFFTALDTPYENIHFIPSLKHMLEKRKRLREQYGIGVNRLIDFLQNISPIPYPTRNDDQALLNDIGGIDSGELILFSRDIPASDYIIATGDKRCLISLT